MEVLQSIGRVFIAIGIQLLVIGMLLYFGNKIGFGKLPGDIYIKKGDNSLFFPITTIVLSIVISTLVSFVLKAVFKK